MKTYHSAKHVIKSATIASLMVISTAANAVQISMDWEGLFTLTNGVGEVQNNSSATTNPYAGFRTEGFGTLTWDTSSETGTGTFVPFLFLGLPSSATSMGFQRIGDGFGGAGNLMLANLVMNFGAITNVPVSLVLDGTGFLDAIQAGLSVGDSISGVGSVTTTESPSAPFDAFAPPIGIAPLSMTTLDPTSGGLPLTDDGISGAPLSVFPFVGFNPNLDVTQLTVSSISAVPLPSALWLFISGIVGLGAPKLRQILRA